MPVFKGEVLQKSDGVSNKIGVSVFQAATCSDDDKSQLIFKKSGC